MREIILGIIVGLLVGMMICGAGFGLSKIFDETERERNARDSECLAIGYELGYKAGRNEALIKKYTPNEFRAIMGFSPIKEEKTDAEDNDTGEAAESE